MQSASLAASQRVVLRGVSFSHPSAPPLLEEVDLSLAPGWSALVGANGSGKTTLLRLLAGSLVPSAGSIERPRDASVIVCAQSVERPVDDALASREDRDAVRLRASLRLDPGALVRWPTLSPGERRRWQIGDALSREPDVLLLDEPTNHLDGEGRTLLVRALRWFRGIGVVVSHDRALLDALAENTVRVAHGRVRLWSGAYAEARAAWEAEARAHADEHERRREEARGAARALDRARREHASADRGRSAASRMRNAHDSDARSSGASTRAMWAEAGAGRTVARRRVELARAEEALAREPGFVRERGRALFVDFEPATRRAVLTIDAPELRVGDRVLLTDVRLSLGRADRVRLCGPNGAGKTTLLAALLSRTPDPRVLFVPQVVSVAETVRAIAALRALAPEAKGRALSLIAALGADPGRLLATGEASPGEARQIAIAAGLAARAHTIVLDEPTNDLDLPAVERLEDALVAFPGALLVVTHDDALAERLGLAPWRIERGQVGVGAAAAARSRF